MKAVKSYLLTTGVGICLALSGCASSPNLASEHSGFLPNYHLLKPIAHPPANTQVYIYNNPSVMRGSYHGVIVEPVLLYQTATKNGITTAQIDAARMHIQQGIMQIVSKKSHLTTTPGSGIARLHVAITGAELDDQGLKPRNFIPISAALKLASMATGYDQKKPVMMVELKFTDSVSGKLLREVLTTISGEYFRDKSNTNAEFTQLAGAWVKQALKYASKH